jgi:hypothetical protein
VSVLGADCVHVDRDIALLPQRGTLGV